MNVTNCNYFYDHSFPIRPLAAAGNMESTERDWPKLARMVSELGFGNFKRHSFHNYTRHCLLPPRVKDFFLKHKKY